MDFQTLLSAIEDGRVKGVASDSRKVRPGQVFVAVKGTQTDGHRYIPQAIANGAAYIVSQEPFASDSVDVILVDDASIALGRICQKMAGNPADKLINLTVTGTNGKTTTCYIVRQIINNALAKCGLIGTIEYDDASGEGLVPSDMTTPDPIRLAEITERMVANGAGYLAIESSSHALEQNRLAGINFKAAAFTNLTGDHLDYHKTMQNYLNSKAKLFEGLGEDAFAILNGDAAESQELAGRTKANVLWYGIDRDADIKAEIVEMDALQTQYRLCWQGGKADVVTAMPGLHNVSNQLAAAGLCLSAGLSLGQVAGGISSMRNVPGRLERVEAGQDFSVLVDYAHTDDALKNVLGTLREICRGRLVVVFGCGGDRDKTKRPRMARVAAAMADKIIVTSDNPRTEDPQAIIADIMAGFAKDDLAKVVVEADRREAIGEAIEIARTDDIVLLAGKGHEDYQVIGTEKIDFDDRKIAGEFLRQR